MVLFASQVACSTYCAFDGPEAEEEMWAIVLDMVAEEEAEREMNEFNELHGASAVDRYLDSDLLDNETYPLFNCSLLEHDVR